MQHRRSRSRGEECPGDLARNHRGIAARAVVDDDIDISDPNEIEWAISTRVQADKDVLIFKNQKGSSLDPSAINEPGKKAMTTKAGVDATIPFGKKDKSFKKERYGKVNVEDYL